MQGERRYLVMTAVKVQWREEMDHRIGLIIAVVTQLRKGSVSRANSGNTEPLRSLFSQTQIYRLFCPQALLPTPMEGHLINMRNNLTRERGEA